MHFRQDGTSYDTQGLPDVYIGAGNQSKIALPPAGLYKRIVCKCACGKRAKKKIIKDEIFQINGNENAFYEVKCD
ncbi:MAG: hypothetical protein WCR52_22270 [Bacteroidota bacterium]